MSDGHQGRFIVGRPGRMRPGPGSHVCDPAGRRMRRPEQPQPHL